MKRSLFTRCRRLSLAMLVLIGLTHRVDDLRAQVAVGLTGASTEEPAPDDRYGVWQTIKCEHGNQIEEMRLRVYPQAAPRPAFRYRLVPAARERVDGNSALFYLKAMGFFEQSNAREQLTRLERKWREEAGEDAVDYPPHIWADMAPESLPMDQVKEYLDLLSFQPEFLYDAARRTRYEHDRAIEREPNPLGYLLPSIQQHRELARVQNVRCRFAIAEGRMDDAVEIVGQMMTLGRHVGQDEFLVCSLVGVAIHYIGVNTGFALSQQREAPNLYWAIAACSDPAIDLSQSFQFEREFLLWQMPMLRDVTEEVRTRGYWSDFTREFTVALDDCFQLGNFNFEDPIGKWDDLQTATAIARSYPAAREFLSKEVGLPDEQLNQYCRAQTVFLAIVKYYEYTQDELMKQFVVPYASRPKHDDESWGARFSLDGPYDFRKNLLALGELLLPATGAVLDSVARVQQQQSLWQTVEALRMSAAENDGKFPPSLDELSVPAPLDPATNRPFEYELDEGVATLLAGKVGEVRYRIKLELANQNQTEEAE